MIILSVCLALYALKRHGLPLSPNKLNFIHYYFGVEIILTTAISVFVIPRWAEEHWAFRFVMNHEKSLEMGFIGILIAISLFPIGIILADKLTRTSSKDFQSFMAKKLSNHSISFPLIIYFLFSVTTVIYLTFIIYKIGYIPQKFFFSSSEKIAEIRGLMTHHFPGNQYLKNLFGLQFLPLLSYSTLVHFFKSKKPLYLAFFVLFSIGSLFFTTLNLSKAGFIFYFMGFPFLLSYYKGYLPVKIILAGGLSFLAFLLLGFINEHNVFNSFVFNVFLKRLLLVQSAGVYLSFDLFPDSFAFLDFSSLGKVSSYFYQFPSVSSQRLIMEYVNPVGVESGTAGYMVSLFIGEAWSNWGWSGVILSSLGVPLFTKTCLNLITKLDKTPEVVACVAFFSFKFLYSQGINHIFFPRILFIPTLFLFIFFFPKILTKIKDQQ